jgi:FdhD protein
VGHTTSPRPTIRLEDVSRRGSKRIDRIDRVVVESPLTIVVEGEVVATTMRTPGHDLDLAAGWLVSEAGLRRGEDIVEMKSLAASTRSGTSMSDASDSVDEIDTVRVHLAPGITPPRPRAYVTSSSCGVCSADVIDEVPEPYAPLHTGEWRLEPQQALDLIEQMRSRQKMFDLTGALHAAALVGPDSEVLFVREDVGRHNAVDKVIGRALMDGLLPLTNHVLVVSGRVSYEIVAKALSACIGSIVAVSGPTTLAVEVARRFDLLLIGFAREDRMNVYSGSEWVRA